MADVGGLLARPLAQSSSDVVSEMSLARELGKSRRPGAPAVYSSAAGLVGVPAHAAWSVAQQPGDPPAGLISEPMRKALHKAGLPSRFGVATVQLLNLLVKMPAQACACGSSNPTDARTTPAARALD